MKRTAITLLAVIAMLQSLSANPEPRPFTPGESVYLKASATLFFKVDGQNHAMRQGQPGETFNVLAVKDGRVFLETTNILGKRVAVNVAPNEVQHVVEPERLVEAPLVQKAPATPTPIAPPPTSTPPQSIRTIDPAATLLEGGTMAFAATWALPALGYVALCFIPAYISGRKGRSSGGAFVASIFLTPAIGLLVALAQSTRQNVLDRRNIEAGAKATNLRETLQWAKQQSKQGVFPLPDKVPNEDPATERQLQYIRNLLQHVDEADLAKLGKWQASALIDEIKNEKAIFTEETMEAVRAFRLSQKRRASAFSFVLFAVVVAILVAVLASR